MTDHGGSPGSAPVLGSAVWEMQPLGSESPVAPVPDWLIKLPWKDATERVATLACDLDGGISMLHKEIAECWDLGDFMWQGL